MEEFGLRLGIGGVLTFKNAQVLRDAVRTVGLEHLILETDCPYLAPVPHRGKRNEPALRGGNGGKSWAELFSVTKDEIIAKTTATASELFRAPLPAS